MGINGVGSYYAQNYATQNRSRLIGRNWSGSNDEAIGNATSLSESSNNGKKIGVTTVGNKGYIAMYADSSTEQEPVVKVGDYEVRVKEVDPHNATKMEMFALMSYLDDQGLTDNQGMKSFNKMTAYSAQAEYNGYCSGISDENAAWTEERDWIAILGNAKESFYKNPQNYEQGLECEKIIDNLRKYSDGAFNSDVNIADIPKVAKQIDITSGDEGIARLEHGIKKIVTAVNPEDGKEYLTYFTKDTIVCKSTEENGETVWTMKLTEEQSELVNKYFENFEANHGEETKWYSGDDMGMVSSKGFWQGFFAGAETVDETQDISDEDYMELIRKQIEEMQEKIDNDEVNESFQIGGQTFTVEEWDEFLKKFDSIQDAMEALMKERHAQMEKKEQITGEMLTSESTRCIYPTDDANGEDVLHITWYTEEGIFCRKAGQTEGYEWCIPFENKEQYNKVMEFISQIPQDCDWRFASQEGFWKDFLDDEIDMGSFIDSIKNTNKKVASKEYSAEEIQEAIDREVQSNQHKKKSLYEMLINTCPEGTNATFRFAGESKIYSFYEYIEELQIRSGEISVDSTSSISNTRRTEIKVSNFKEYETANYKFVPEPTIGKGGMRILKNGQSVAVFSVDNLKIRVDEQTGTRVLISEIGGYNGIWYDAISVDAELENGLAEAIGVDDIPEVALEGYYIGTHAGTGIQYVMKPGEEGRGGKILFKSEADVARYNALAEEYYTRYPNLIESQEEGRIWATFEILGMAERTASGIVSVHPDNISYHDNSDYKNNWSIMLNDETWELLYEWLEENRNRMEEMNKFSSWRDILDEIGGSYERIWSDEELDQGYLNN